jgi:hypothetical protein
MAAERGRAWVDGEASGNLAVSCNSHVEIDQLSVTYLAKGAMPAFLENSVLCVEAGHVC